MFFKVPCILLTLGFSAINFTAGVRPLYGYPWYVCSYLYTSQMLRLEFAHYDYKLRGTISAKDFALSMVASADIKHLNKLLDRADDLDNEPHLRNMRVTFEEFKSFAELRRKTSV